MLGKTQRKLRTALALALTNIVPICQSQNAAPMAALPKSLTGKFLSLANPL
jgi:hypothetical protein